MDNHDEYGKRVVRRASSAIRQECHTCGPSVAVDYGAGNGARIDATVGSSIAVEVESRVSKQVRGALLDLICHPNPKKLLILLPVHMSNPDTTAAQCRSILQRFFSPSNFRVVILHGSGRTVLREDDDVLAVQAALADLG